MAKRRITEKLRAARLRRSRCVYLSNDSAKAIAEKRNLKAEGRSARGLCPKPGVVIHPGYNATFTKTVGWHGNRNQR